MVSPLARFILYVTLWLPVCFGAWYFFAILWVHPVAMVTDWIMAFLLPEIVESVRAYGPALQVLTRVTVSGSNLPEGAVGEIVLDIEPLVYAYGVPLYTALLLASPGTENEKWGRWLIGVVLLFAVVIFGAITALLKTLALDLGAYTETLMPVSVWGRELIAIGYQFGYLIVPSVTPPVIWLVQFRDYVPRLTQAQG
jgi:hypothetical protein